MCFRAFGLILIALGIGIVLTLILPPWMLVLLLGLGMIVAGLIVWR